MLRSHKRYGSSGASAGKSSNDGPTPGRTALSSARYGAVQAKRAPIQRHGDGGGPAGELAPLSSSGQALPAPLQAKMESSFGADFSGVRVHADSEQPQQVGALAYTQGTDIAFAPGQYDPGSASGQELIGHELTHVVQQASGRVADPAAGQSPVNDDAALEHEADTLGAQAARGSSVAVSGGAAGGAVQSKKAPVQAKKVVQAKKSRKKSAGKAVGKGLINVVFPVFTWKAFFEGIEAGWSKEENPLLGKSAPKNAGIKALITLKEIGQLVAGLATMAATIYGIASIFFPAVAPIGAFCGLVATIAHAVTFVLRAVHLALIQGALSKAKSPDKMEQKKKLEQAKWDEIGGMIGNGIGVIFGGFGGAFSASPAAMAGDAATAMAGGSVASGAAQAGTIGAATGSLNAGGANAIAGVFGQTGNSVADAAGGASSRHGKLRRQDESRDLLAGVEEEGGDEDSGPSAADLTQAVAVVQEVMALHAAAQNPTVAPPAPGDVAEVDAELGKVAAKASDAASPVAAIQAAEPGEAVEVSDAEAAAADSDLSAHGEEDEGGGPPAEEEEAAPVPGIQIEVTPPEDEGEGSGAVSPPASSPGLLAPPAAAPVSEARPPMPPVQTKRAAGRKVQRKRKPVQAKGSWFKRKVIKRVKKSLAKAKAKFMAKVYQLLGLDTKAAEAKQQLAQLSAESGGARAAEAAKKSSASAAAAQAQQLKARAEQAQEDQQ